MPEETILWDLLNQQEIIDLLFVGSMDRNELLDKYTEFLLSRDRKKQIFDLLFPCKDSRSSIFIAIQRIIDFLLKTKNMDEIKAVVRKFVKG